MDSAELPYSYSSAGAQPPGLKDAQTLPRPTEKGPGLLEKGLQEKAAL